MLRLIARWQYRQALEAMNSPRLQAILGQLAPTFEIAFIGDTSLGGARRTKDALRRWFQRCFGLFPDARFQMHELAVDGWPWGLLKFWRVAQRLAEHGMSEATAAPIEDEPFPDRVESEP